MVGFPDTWKFAMSAYEVQDVVTDDVDLVKRALVEQLLSETDVSIGQFQCSGANLEDLVCPLDRLVFIP